MLNKPRSKTLLKNHEDWIWPFKYIPRRWNAYLGGSRPWPKRLLGNNTRTATQDGVVINLEDVPAPGTWTFCFPWYFAIQSQGGWFFRIGFRKDYWGDNNNLFDHDDYWVLGLTIKKEKV